MRPVPVRRVRMLSALVFSLALLIASAAIVAHHVYADTGGGAVTFHLNVDHPVSVTIPDSCTGESVSITGAEQLQENVTVNDNHTSTEIAINGQGLSGTGLNSGAKYQVPVNEHDTETQGTVVGLNGATEVTISIHERFVTAGGGTNFVFTELEHVTFNSDGTVTTFFSDFDTTCQ